MKEWQEGQLENGPASEALKVEFKGEKSKTRSASYTGGRNDKIEICETNNFPTLSILCIKYKKLDDI